MKELKQPLIWPKIVNWAIFFCLVAFVFLIWAGAHYFLKGEKAYDGNNPSLLQNLANFGSYLQGTTASYWALAGVVLILVAFLGQMKQIALQQQDLNQQEARLEKQENMLRRQNFESSFFQLLNLQNQIASQMRQRLSRWQGPDSVIDVIEGRNCFSIWYRNLKQIQSNFTLNKNWKGATEQERIGEMYEEFYSEKGHQEDLAHYFRTLYHLIKFVAISDVVVEYNDKRRYTSLVRAQLSAYELALLFYNGLSPYGEGFKPWIEEFGLLKNLNIDLLLSPEHENLYDKKARA